MALTQDVGRVYKKKVDPGKKVRKTESSRQNTDTNLLQSRTVAAKEKRRKVVVVDKQKREGELSKLCSELKIKEETKKKKKAKSKKKKKSKEKETKEELRPVTRSSVANSEVNGETREKKKKSTTAKDGDQNVVSVTIRKSKNRKKKKKSTKTDGEVYFVDDSGHSKSKKGAKRRTKSNAKNRNSTVESGVNDSEAGRPKSVQSKKNLFEKVFSPKTAESNNGKDKVAPLNTPKTLKKGFVALNTVSPSAKTPLSKGQKPPKRIMDNSQHDKGRAQGYIDSATGLLSDKSCAGEVQELVHRINEAGGFPITRRLSLRDNELVGQMVMAIRNDPRIKSIEVSPSQFGTISSTLLEQFVGSLRINLHLKSLTFRGVELGNDFLFSLASSMESNFVLEEIDLSRNLFTNAGLAEFCQVVASSNETCRILNLENQTTPISNASEEDVLEAFEQNRVLQEVKLDFESEEAAGQLRKIIKRNKADSSFKASNDEKLLSVLRYEAERAEELLEEQKEDDSVFNISEGDWDHLYQLSVQFDKHKLKKHIQESSDDFVPSTQRKNGDSMTKEEKKKFLFGEFRKNLGESISCFNADGSFLTPDFISKYFEEDKENAALTFDYHGQWKLFKRFPIHDPARQLIVRKFVEALVSHPRANEITSINMANTGCGDDFLVAFASRCLEDETALPSLLILNFETNFINADGVTALAKVIGSPKSLKFLQVVRLENQKFLLKSKGELALARAMRVNFSVVVMSLRIRNLMERQQISKSVLRNVELIRQARQRHFKVTGKIRERNDVEKFFDKIAENDPSVNEVSLVGNKRFLTLTSEEKKKAASSFATNTNVKKLNLNSCGIDDEFAIALALALKQNSGITRVLLEGNSISGVGITALFEALAENSSIEEMRLHKQSKTLNTSEEHSLADILLPNTTLTKVGIDLRTTMAQVQLDKKLNLNRNSQLKLRAEAKGDTFSPSDVLSSIKF